MTSPRRGLIFETDTNWTATTDTGARLSIDGSVEGLAMTEFFLVLSTMGKAYRRCPLAWVNGNEVGVHFLRPSEKKNKS
jgi:hypothetical protein